MAIKQMGVRMDTGSPEYRWRKAQKSSQESLIRLIDIAIENYGYVGFDRCHYQ
jgi:hypothetical protein